MHTACFKKDKRLSVLGLSDNDILKEMQIFFALGKCSRLSIIINGALGSGAFISCYNHLSEQGIKRSEGPLLAQKHNR